MKEELLHYIWKTKKFDLKNLITSEGELLTILNFGIHNHNAGPDFLNGQVKIGSTIWNGHIEIHIKSSDWNTHKHQNDKAYNNVILHVVYDDDKTILNNNNQQIPTLELRDRFPEHLFQHYTQLMSSLKWIPCADNITTINTSKLPFFLERVLTKRLLHKHARIKNMLKDTKQDWEEVLYRLLLRYLGLKINGDAFEVLGRVMPLSTLKKQGLSLLQKESILLGQAGFLNAQDEYAIQLGKEYNHQKAKYDLKPMTGVEWKFSKLRPANFPTIRIAQIAALYHKTPQLFNKIISAPELKNIEKLIEIEASSYWDTHYLLGKESIKRTKKIGPTTKQILLINVIVPLIFTYAQITDNLTLQEKAIDLLSELKSEKNNVIRRWSSLGIIADSAAQSQALLELKSNYCDKQKCLECQIGQQIIFS